MKAFTLILIITPIILKAQNPSVIPKVDPSLSKFIYDLHVAVEKKDKAHLIKCLSPQVTVSFGDDAGIESFKRYWDFDSNNTRVWSVLRNVLRPGGTYSDYGYTAPFVYSEWPDEYDAYEYEMIVGENVNLREGPGTNFNVKGQLSYDIVTNDKSKANGDWAYVVTYDKSLEGYIHSSFVYSPIDYRIGITKVDNAWKIAFLVAGD